MQKVWNFSRGEFLYDFVPYVFRSDECVLCKRGRGRREDYACPLHRTLKLSPKAKLLRTVAFHILSPLLTIVVAIYTGGINIVIVYDHERKRMIISKIGMLIKNTKAVIVSDIEKEEYFNFVETIMPAPCQTEALTTIDELGEYAIDMLSGFAWEEFVQFLKDYTSR